MAITTEAVKRHLKITWEAADTTAEVADIMARAEYILNDYLGSGIAFSQDEVTGREADLYLNLCLYLYNGLSQAEFEQAYKGPLLIARERYEAEGNGSDEGE